MKILHLSTAESWRGGEQQLAYLVDELIGNQIDTEIACKTGSEMHRFCEKHCIPHRALPFRSAYDLKTIIKIKRLCLENNFDILHMHTSKGHTLGVLAGLFGLEIPMVLSRRVDFAIKNNVFSKYKYNYSQIRRILSVSQAVTDIISPDLRRPEVATTIHSGVDLKKFSLAKSDFLKKKFQIGEDKKLIGNTSALAEHKDYFTFIDTAELLLKSRKDLVFFIMGEGSLRLPIETYIREKHIEDHVILTGFVENIAEALRSLDYFLFTSKTEGLGTSILDAMACGIPVIASRAGGIPEMIEHEKNGILVNPGDIDGFVDGLSRVICSPELAKKISGNASKRVAHFQKGIMAQKTIKVYRELLKE
ncbi:MAG: glycosyltransferase family 4 protein [Cyclobacteriaceae bacterium]|nr:glycosyltransferase family 4 protein [Cyclobacteriaceae bacterium HetDA_MAG_MS6]